LATLDRTDAGWRGRFTAMASPCEVLVEGVGEPLAAELAAAAETEALRIERKFSRYRDDSVIASIHAARGRAVEVDTETADLLDYAATCHALSGGLFDITSGVLRAVWRFDGSDRVPEAAAVQALLPLVGWTHVQWQRPTLVVPAGMELDLGGLGKEYAVDRTLALLRQAAPQAALLVNFGGDLAVSGPRAGGERWQVGVERPGGHDAALQLELAAGALATSGDARRFLLKDGERLGHILDPRDGWPVRGAPRSVTVAAGRCIEAGTLATLALLQGPEAESWLAQQGAPHWVLH
jgi:thiamine biosynthesis lipoprotein